MAKRTASDIMEKAFITASPETSVFDLVNLFVKNRITLFQSSMTRKNWSVS